jgi:PAS domain S-box-containing protein
MLELAPNGWVLVDGTGKILYTNSEVESLFGYSRSELINQHVEVLVPERLRRVHLVHRRGYMDHPSLRPMGLGMSLVGRRKDGSEFPVEISLSPIEGGGAVYVIAVIRDITERQMLEDERNHFRMELEMERERDRIGMDLHDGIMQEIYASGLTLELALGDLEEDPALAGEGIEKAIEQLHAVIRNIRSYIFDLRPREFSGNLVSALAELAREFRQNTQIATVDILPDKLPDIATERAVAVYHIVHEGLSNVRKHANASEVALTAYVVDGVVKVEVSDNGEGFDISQELPQVHRGLRNMTARARVAGARLNIDSAPGKGTRLQIELPVEAP